MKFSKYNIIHTTENQEHILFNSLWGSTFVISPSVIINHQNTSTYGKHISGTVGVGTQSNSSNMETIQIFVAYAHSTVSVTFSADVALQWKQVGMSINFTPQKKTTIIARGNATFKYNGQGYQTAGTV